jgi:hypothetical protein
VIVAGDSPLIGDCLIDVGHAIAVGVAHAREFRPLDHENLGFVRSHQPEALV